LTPQKSINIKGSLLDLSVPRVMGILNVTPDSFYKGSRISSTDEVLLKAEGMINDGATFLDIGGYSTRPGSIDISEEEELQRTIPIIEALRKTFPEVYLSIDSFRSGVAKRAVEAGADLVNDISCGELDGEMLGIVGTLGVPYVGMHMRGTPQTMSKLTNYEDLVGEVAKYFALKSKKVEEAGIKDFIIDPGFGFAKTKEQNFELLNQLEFLNQLGFTTLCGVSRKSMIYKSLNVTAEEALNGTTVLNTVALLKGVSVLRVHDVKEAIEAIKLINLLQN
jgi:dihydropteroate synthase